MNCQSLIANMGFNCQPLSVDTLRIWSPFTYGSDGEVVGLYVESYTGGFRITDNAESLMHASSMGIKISKQRIEALRRASGTSVQISDGGEISMIVDEDHIGDGVASVLNAAMAVSHFETVWAPRNKSESFIKIVGDTLEEKLGNKLLRKVSVVGASGHQLELPIAIKVGHSLSYIQPIAANDDLLVDWNNVYTAFGKMMDLKNAGADSSARIVVIEDASNDPEISKAVTMLAMCASVVKYSNLRLWSERFK